jgi:hypothetical protein
MNHWPNLDHMKWIESHGVDATSLDLSLRCVTMDKKPQGLVGVLISMDDLCEAPSDYESKGRLIHYKSPFGTRFIVCETLVHLKEYKGLLRLLKWLGQWKYWQQKVDILDTWFHFRGRTWAQNCLEDAWQARIVKSVHSKLTAWHYMKMRSMKLYSTNCAWVREGRSGLHRIFSSRTYTS